MRRYLLTLAVLSLSLPAWAQPAPPAEVQLKPQGYGWLLTDAKGMTLYTFTRDVVGKPPACDAACMKTWPPLVAPAGAAPAGDWSVVARGDGLQQWAFRDKPLYTHSRDTAAGDMNGDELAQQWFAAVQYIDMPPGFAVQKSANGHLLVDPRRMTLYTSAADPDGKSNCADACARTWRPVEAWGMAAAGPKDWAVVERDDGTRQWAFKGKPLYRYAGDFAAGEIAGDELDGHAALVLQQPPANPDWVQYHGSDGGEVLTDPNGKTLYAFDTTRGQGQFSNPKDTWHLWKPVEAGADAKPVGYWSIVATEESPRQWHFKGMPVFTNINDKLPGDLYGVRRMDWNWRTLTRSGQSLPGSGL